MKKRKLRAGALIRIGGALIAAAFLVSCITAISSGIYNAIHPIRYIYSKENTLQVSVPYIVDGEAAEKKFSIPRGTAVRLSEKKEKESTFQYEGMQISLDNRYLKNTLEECIQIDTVYPRRLINLREKKDGPLCDEIVKKGESVQVTKVDLDDLDQTTGEIRWYQIEKDGKKYWLNGKYVETDKDLATKNWNTDITYSTYWDEYYGEGYSKDAYIDQIDYKPTQTVEYEDNSLLTNCNAVHISLENMIQNKEYYLNLNKETGVNAYVVELKGDAGYLWYDSKAADEYLNDPKQAKSNVLASMDELKDLIKEFQDQGYYIIGRIVTFKDQIFALQNSKESITDNSGNLIVHNDEYWPSAYSRKAWMYNVAIAKEVADCGVNEIQFDYVRFPDGLSASMDSIDLKNTYDESKTAALQGFLQYAKEELEPYHVYVAADVFAWPLVAQDDQDIGQFYLAIANSVDVICPMPYSDHFSAGAMGIEDPGSDPGKVLEEYTRLADKEMKELENPPVYRSWIQAYGDLTPDQIKAQIKGINDSGYEGYMVWYGFGNPEDLDSNKTGYIDSAIQK